MSGQARFSRASHRDSSPAYSPSSRGSSDNDSFLITELKEVDAESHCDQAWRTYRPKKKQGGVPTFKINSDGEQEYDTDLEIEGELTISK
jgi:hypothetical protein